MLVELVCVDIVYNTVRNEVLDTLSPLQTPPDLCGADIIGNPLRADMYVVLNNAQS